MSMPRSTGIVKPRLKTTRGKADTCKRTIMSVKVHYEDNLFYLSTLIKSLKAGLSLDIDPEYFIDQIVEDILFVDSTLVKSFNSLKANPHLIKRKEYLRVILRTKKVFIDFLEEIVEGRLAFSSNLEPFFPKFRASLNEHIRDISEIHALLDEPSASEGLDEDIISQTEYLFLLKEDEETSPSQE